MGATESLISARAAARLLAEVGLAREQSRLVLAWGLAESALAEACPAGAVVIRCGLRWPSGAATVAGPWDMKATSRAHLRLHAGFSGFPLVATVSGFVVEVASITGVVPGRVDPSSRARGSHTRGSRALSMLELGPPGDWASLLTDGDTGRRFPIGPGGRWLLWQPRPGQPRPGQAPLTHPLGETARGLRD